jgi:hypothetical protein
VGSGRKRKDKSFESQGKVSEREENSSSRRRSLRNRKMNLDVSGEFENYVSGNINNNINSSICNIKTNTSRHNSITNPNTTITPK